MKLKGIIASSQNPEEVANTVKGIVLALSSIIILIAANVFHFHMTASDVAGLATELGMAAGAMWTMYGLIMKIVVFFGKKPE